MIETRRLKNVVIFIQTKLRIDIKHSAKANHKYMKNVNTSKSSSFIMYLEFSNQHENALSESTIYEQFECVEDISMFSDNFMKNYNKNSEIVYTLVVDTEYPDYAQPVFEDIIF